MFASRASSSALGKLQDEDLEETLKAVTEEKEETQETRGEHLVIDCICYICAYDVSLCI